MIWETQVAYTIIDKKGNDRQVKEKYLVEHGDTFTEVEDKLFGELGARTCFEVQAIKQSKAKEILSYKKDVEEKIWLGELQDVFHTDEGEEKYIKYKVFLCAKTFDEAKASLGEYIKQGYDMDIVNIKLTNFEDILR